MGFALTLFVEAANRRILPRAPDEDADQHTDVLCRYLYQALCADVGSVAGRHLASDHETTLYRAFQTLCSHYTDDPLQAAVCARVLAFYFLMERSRGAALRGWTQPTPETPHLVSLHSAVVDTIATVPLHGNVLLSPDMFLERVVASAAAACRPPEH